MTSPPITKLREFFRLGEPQVWLCGGAAAMVLLLFFTMLGVVFINGSSAFWVRDVAHLTLVDGQELLAAQVDETEDRLQFYIGNRDLNRLDFRWLQREALAQRRYDPDVVMVERLAQGPFMGYLQSVNVETRETAGDVWRRFRDERDRLDLAAVELTALQETLSDFNLRMEKLRLEALRKRADDPAEAERLDQERRETLSEFEEYSRQMDELRTRLRQRTITMADASGRISEIAILDIVRAYRPNELSVFGKIGVYVDKVWELMTESPRESNTEGGLFPAILGTVMMVMLMSLFGVPLGVIAAVYLREYAKEGFMVNLVRIAVNNLAGVPSIVYGMFGLGFFVYGVGGTLDTLFFPERAPLPTFGTGGLLWASLTMALLTVPVVIVSTEEGLNSVPQGVRDSSIALGASKFQTLVRVVLPMATPGMLTGLILAITRAAGEVAPLMLVGVVKVAPSLPADGQFPYVHLDRKFMHLGFHIFDVGFQSPNVEAAKPMVYITTLLLLVIVLTMSFLAMYLRNQMKKRYAAAAF